LTDCEAALAGNNSLEDKFQPWLGPIRAALPIVNKSTAESDQKSRFSVPFKSIPIMPKFYQLQGRL
jgi:hypothetical protein